MFDVANKASQRTYRANDPAQTIYRSLLEGYSDAELADIEDEIGAFTRSGMVLPVLDFLLSACSATPEAA